MLKHAEEQMKSNQTIYAFYAPLGATANVRGHLVNIYVVVKVLRLLY